MDADLGLHCLGQHILSDTKDPYGMSVFMILEISRDYANVQRVKNKKNCVCFVYSIAARYYLYWLT